jgi:restriction endonuclease S subunit
MVTGYILYNLLCDWFTKYAVLFSDRVAMPKVNRETLGNCLMVVPPIDEQRRIVGFIEEQTTQIDSVTDKISMQIAKLREYRQTVISAAVTGQIDLATESQR